MQPVEHSIGEAQSASIKVQARGHVGVDYTRASERKSKVGEQDKPQHRQQFPAIECSLPHRPISADRCHWSPPLRCAFS